MNIFQIAISSLALVASLVALVISVKAWHKNRAIYGIERAVLRQVRGRRDDVVVEQCIENINRKLISGKYSIISINSREADGDFEVILGKIKK